MDLNKLMKSLRLIQWYIIKNVSEFVADVMQQIYQTQYYVRSVCVHDRSDIKDFRAGLNYNAMFHKTFICFYVNEAKPLLFQSLFTNV